MKIILAILFLFMNTLCFADIDKPRILVRKIDNIICGIGYTNFEGIENLQDYEVKEIEPEELSKYQQEMKERIQKEDKIRQEEKRQKELQKKADKQKAIIKLKALGLTEKEIEALSD